MNEFCRLRRNERYGACPDEVYKCALVNKGIISQSLPQLVFSKILLLPSCVLRDKGSLSLPRPSWRSAPARCFP